MNVKYIHLFCCCSLLVACEGSVTSNGAPFDVPDIEVEMKSDMTSSVDMNQVDRTISDMAMPKLDMAMPDLSVEVDSQVPDMSEASDEGGGIDVGEDMAQKECTMPASSPEAGLAFPTAEGFGRFSKGGRGGAVIEITTLADRGPGSLRACLGAKGPRTCVFRVGGLIQLESDISITEPFLTLAGQTAPGDGVLVRGGQIETKTNDVIIRYVRTATGPEKVPGQGSSRGGIEAFKAQRVIVDHCSMFWAPDDTVSIWDPATKDVTYQWNMIAEGLTDSLNGSTFGKGMLIGDGATQISVLHNVFAHHVDRVPQIQTTDVQMVNNLVYNVPGNVNVNPAQGPVDISFVGNYFLSGPDSRFSISTSIRTLGLGWPGQINFPKTYAEQTRLYVKDNYHDKLRPDPSLPEDKVIYQGADPLPVVSTPLGFPTIHSLIPAAQVPSTLTQIGATRPVRLDLDKRVVMTINNRTGTAMLKSPADVGGYPNLPEAVRQESWDTDKDGMPNIWEMEQGFDPDDPADGGLDLDGDSYTNLEEYLNLTDPHCPS